MSEIYVIEADHYRDEVAALRADPIIIGMVAELVAAGKVPADLEGWGSNLGALEEYKNRGGVGAESIGGPIRAIKASLAEAYANLT